MNSILIRNQLIKAQSVDFRCELDSYVTSVYKMHRVRKKGEKSMF